MGGSVGGAHPAVCDCELGEHHDRAPVTKAGADRPAGFGQVLGQLGMLLPGLMGFVVTFVELVGGFLLIVGLLSWLVALVLTTKLTVALLPVEGGRRPDRTPWRRR